MILTLFQTLAHLPDLAGEQRRMRMAEADLERRVNANAYVSRRYSEKRAAALRGQANVEA